MHAMCNRYALAIPNSAYNDTIPLLAWGLMTYLSGVVKEDPATLHDQSPSAAIAQHRNRPTIQRNCSDSPPRMATPGFKPEHDEDRLAARLSLEGGYQPRSKPTTGKVQSIWRYPGGTCGPQFVIRVTTESGKMFSCKVPSALRREYRVVPRTVLSSSSGSETRSCKSDTI
ncbi:hypothetical protein ACJJTC_017904 [Scirpophaga incertulas]